MQPSVSQRQAPVLPFHGGNGGSNPPGDATLRNLAGSPRPEGLSCFRRQPDSTFAAGAPPGRDGRARKGSPENRERHCKALGYTRGKMRGLHKPTRTHGRPRRRIKNPVPVTAEHVHPFPQMRPIAAVPGVGAVLKRARTPYKKSPLSEDEALNLVCDARSLEPTHPIEKLFKKFSHELER